MKESSIDTADILTFLKKNFVWVITIVLILVFAVLWQRLQSVTKERDLLQSRVKLEDQLEKLEDKLKEMEDREKVLYPQIEAKQKELQGLQAALDAERKKLNKVNAEVLKVKAKKLTLDETSKAFIDLGFKNQPMKIQQEAK